MSNFTTFLAANLGLIRILLGFAAATLLAYIYRRELVFAIMDLYYRFWKISNLSKDPTRSPNEGWSNAELRLCSDYRKHVDVIKESEFNRGIDYLQKAQDLGRKPMPGWMVVFMVTLIALEGLGFSYLLGTWMAMDGSANLHMVLMLAIVSVLCGILAIITHAGGHQLRHYNQVAKNQRLFKEDNSQNTSTSKSIALKDNQNIDDDKPEYIQCLNRIGTDKSRVAIYVATAAIVVIATASTYMRWEHLKTSLVKEAQAQSQSVDNGNPFATNMPALPDDVAQSQKKADDKANKDALNDTKDEGLAAFVMLGFIFVVTQIVGIGAGYSYGFAGKESKAAYKSTGGFSTYEEYLRFYAPLVHTAESRLRSLQQKMMAHSSNRMQFSKTFSDYLAEFGNAHIPIVHKADERAASAISQAPLSAPIVQNAAIVTDSVESILAKLDAMRDKAEKKELLVSLGEPLSGQVMSVLKQRKDDESRRKADLDAKLDELL